MEKAKPKSLGKKAEGWMFWVPEERLAQMPNRAEYLVGGKTVAIELSGVDPGAGRIFKGVLEGGDGYSPSSNYGVHVCHGAPSRCKMQIRRRGPIFLKLEVPATPIGDPDLDPAYVFGSDSKKHAARILDKDMRGRLVEFKDVITSCSIDAKEVCIWTSGTLSRTNMAHMQKLADIVTLACDLADRVSTSKS
ncbi:MAG: hypothetical protein V1875_00140 [Candidatus Altiarchaeota archaeon]